MAPFQGLGFASNAGVETSTALTSLVHRVPPAWGRAPVHPRRAAAEGSDVGRVWGWATWPPARCTALSRGLGAAGSAQKQGQQWGCSSTRHGQGRGGRRAAGGCPQAQGLPSAASGPRAWAHAGIWHWARHGISAPLTASCRGATRGRICCDTAAQPRGQPEAGTARPPCNLPPCPQPPRTEPELCETPVPVHNSSHSQDHGTAPRR